MSQAGGSARGGQAGDLVGKDGLLLVSLMGIPICVCIVFFPEFVERNY